MAANGCDWYYTRSQQVGGPILARIDGYCHRIVTRCPQRGSILPRKVNRHSVWHKVRVVSGFDRLFMAKRAQLFSFNAALMSINVVNNSNRIIRHLYLVQTEQSAWGPDLMNQDASLTTGQTFTITDVSCATNEIKVIAEDPQGCFMYGTVSCAEASNTWTITNDTPLDCGN